MTQMRASKTALVTGGTSGIGLSIVRALASTGTQVYFIGTNEARGKRVEEELAGGDHAGARFIRLDLSDVRAVRDFARGFVSEVPTLDVLANVAGVMLPTRQVTKEGFEKTFAIDHLSAFVLCTELTPSLAEAPHGRIVNVAGAPAQVLKARLDFQDLQLERNYSLMRAAIQAVHAKTVMTEILAERLAPEGIDVNAFHPGAVKSDLFRNMRFPMNVVFGFARRFMSTECASGIYAATAEQLNGVSGQLFVGQKPRPLNFAQEYKDRVWAASESAVARALNS